MQRRRSRCSRLDRVLEGFRLHLLRLFGASRLLRRHGALVLFQRLFEVGVHLGRTYVKMAKRQKNLDKNRTCFFRSRKYRIVAGRPLEAEPLA